MISTDAMQQCNLNTENSTFSLKITDVLVNTNPPEGSKIHRDHFGCLLGFQYEYLKHRNYEMTQKWFLEI